MTDDNDIFADEKSDRRKAIQLFNRFYQPENGKRITKAEARRRVRLHYPNFV
jgi:hypothetical protein